MTPIAPPCPKDKGGVRDEVDVFALDVISARSELVGRIALDHRPQGGVLISDPLDLVAGYVVQGCR